MPPSVLRGRALAPGEALWTDEDRLEAMTFVDCERDACPGCGQPLSESTLDESERAYTADERQCHGCVARDARAESQQYPGRLIAVSRKGDA